MSPLTEYKHDIWMTVVNLFHNGMNKGKEPCRLVVFVAGEKGVPFLIKRRAGKNQ